MRPMAAAVLCSISVLIFSWRIARLPATPRLEAAAALLNQGTTGFAACTINGNSAPSGGGGVFNNGATVSLEDTIVAGNTTSQNSLIASDIAGTSTVSGSFNLIGTGGSDGLQNGANGNIVLPSLSTLGLAPLGYYGGLTETMAAFARQRGDRQRHPRRLSRHSHGDHDRPARSADRLDTVYRRVHG